MEEDTLYVIFLSDQWKRLADNPSFGINNDFHIVKFHGQLYAFPSSYGNAEGFNPVLNAWSMLDISANYSPVVAIK